MDICPGISSRDQRSARHRALSADRLMLPLSALFALLTVPGWLMLRHASIPVPASWHGHEMLFGYTLSVIAEFLVTRISRGVLAALARTLRART
jgi:uncharacterized protein involved in response to NO